MSRLPVDPKDPAKGEYLKKTIASQRKAKRARWRADKAELAKRVGGGIRCACLQARLKLSKRARPEAYCPACGARFVEGRVIPPKQRDADDES